MAKRSRGESITSPSDQQLPVSQSSTAPQPDSSDAGPPSSPAKYTQLDSTSSDYHSHDVMRCSLAPHREPISFASYEEYEVHYIQAHVNRCSECGRNFPTELFLSLHIEENHDPLIEARKARGERTYGCFVEGCERKCSTPQKRRRHLIDKHMFPKSYNFFIVNDGIDNHRSMLLRTGAGATHGRRVSLSTPSSAPPGGGSPPHESRLRRRKFSQSVAAKTDTQSSSPVKGSRVGEGKKNRAEETGSGDVSPGVPRTATRTSPEHSSNSGGDGVADLERSMAALKFVPPSVTRGKIG